MNHNLTKISQETADRLTSLTTQAAPFLAEISKILRDNGLYDFEVNVGGKNSFYWSGGLDRKQSPNQDELAQQILTVLDQAYPGGILSVMGMIYNPNRNIAYEVAKIVSTHRAKDRREVAGQIVALLAAFEQGS